jgi:hypothetical protein
MKTKKHLALALILMLVSCLSNAQTLGNELMPEREQFLSLDTIQVVLLVSDTSIDKGKAWHQKGYQVREKYCCTNGNETEYAYYMPVPYYKHYLFLDEKRNVLDKRLCVWQFAIK